MKQRILTSLAVLAVWCAAGVPFASAQFIIGQPPGRIRPSVSPYVNLGGGAMSYYGIIRPQLDQARSISQLQSTVSRISPDGTIMPVDPLNPNASQPGLQTGHGVTYFNYGTYYPMTPTGVTTSMTGSPGFSMGMGGYNMLSSGLGSGIGGLQPRAFFGTTMNAFPR
jgi:hypothetical protein